LCGVSADRAGEGGAAAMDAAADSGASTADGRVILMTEDAKILATIHHLYRQLRRLPGTNNRVRQQEQAYRVIEAQIRALSARYQSIPRFPRSVPDPERPT